MRAEGAFGYKTRYKTEERRGKVMHVAKTRCSCDRGHVFDAEVIENAPISVVSASMMAVRCPTCSSSKIFLGGEMPGRPETAPLSKRIGWWEENGDAGVSSATIWSALSGTGHLHGYLRGGTGDAPHDPDDYSRCRKLLDLIPEWEDRIADVAAFCPEWAGFVSRWAKMKRLWEEESPSGRAPKLYALIKEARTQ